MTFKLKTVIPGDVQVSKRPPRSPMALPSHLRSGVLQRKTAAPQTRPSNTIQGYYGDDWEPPGYAAAFRAEAQAAIAGEWGRSAGYQKGPAEARVDVTRANTFASYATLVYRSDDGANTIVRFGVRLSGNPSNDEGRMYPDHSTRAAGYNRDCAEYYLIKQARRMIPAIQYRGLFPPRPTLYVYSDHSPCPRCQEDFDTLQALFKDVQLVIMWERRYMAHRADDRWGIPGGQRIVGIVAPEDPARISGTKRPSAADEEAGWEVVGRR